MRWALAVLLCSCAPVGVTRAPALFFVNLAPVVHASVDDVDSDMDGTQIDVWLRVTDGGALLEAQVTVDASDERRGATLSADEASVRVTLPRPHADGTSIALDATALEESGRRLRTSAVITVVP